MPWLASYGLDKMEKEKCRSRWFAKDSGKAVIHCDVALSPLIKIVLFCRRRWSGAMVVARQAHWRRNNGSGICRSVLRQQLHSLGERTITPPTPSARARTCSRDCIAENWIMPRPTRGYKMPWQASDHGAPRFVSGWRGWILQIFRRSAV